MTAVLRAARAGLALGLLSVAGCGVPTSGVIGAGAPATGVPARTTVYFLADSDLRPVPRRTPYDDTPVAAAVQLLLAGPTPAEARTLSTALPAVRGGVDVRTDGDSVTVRFPAGVDRLDARAMAQLTCTVERAVGRSSTVPSAAERSSAPPVQRGAVGVVPRHVGVRAVGTTWKTVGTDAACPAG
ncbi:GerMN domain-containing protein [Streptomyces carpinensis]|uniref:GerMN domain-containing protein n=1 Tax=Streptomyces carpinensis TaxID=66369 RepID=UPI000A3B0C6B|nr:GerMN domain-containing protein [Streptomyces carpinensis]